MFKKDFCFVFSLICINKLVCIPIGENNTELRILFEIKVKHNYFSLLFRLESAGQYYPNRFIYRLIFKLQ